MKAYFRRLPKHPGFNLALVFSLMGFVAGATAHQGGTKRALVGALVMSVYWIPVLITNRSRYD